MDPAETLKAALSKQDEVLSEQEKAITLPGRSTINKWKGCSN